MMHNQLLISMPKVLIKTEVNKNCNSASQNLINELSCREYKKMILVKLQYKGYVQSVWL